MLRCLDACVPYRGISQYLHTCGIQYVPPPLHRLERHPCLPPLPCPRSWQPGVGMHGFGGVAGVTGRQGCHGLAHPCKCTAQDVPSPPESYGYMWATFKYHSPWARYRSTEYLRSTPAHHRRPMSPTQVTQVLDEQEKGGPHIICDSCYCGNPPRIHGCRFTLHRPCSASGDFIKAICLGTLGLPLPHGTCSRGHIHKISTPPTFFLRHLLDISAIQTWYRIPAHARNSTRRSIHHSNI